MYILGLIFSENLNICVHNCFFKFHTQRNLKCSVITPRNYRLYKCIWVGHIVKNTSPNLEWQPMYKKHQTLRCPSPHCGRTAPTLLAPLPPCSHRSPLTPPRTAPSAPTTSLPSPPAGTVGHHRAPAISTRCAPSPSPSPRLPGARHDPLPLPPTGAAITLTPPRVATPSFFLPSTRRSHGPLPLRALPTPLSSSSPADAPSPLPPQIRLHRARIREEDGGSSNCTARVRLPLPTRASSVAHTAHEVRRRRGGDVAAAMAWCTRRAATPSKMRSGRENLSLSE